MTKEQADQKYWKWLYEHMTAHSDDYDSLLDWWHEKYCDRGEYWDEDGELDYERMSDDFLALPVEDRLKLVREWVVTYD